MLTKKEIKDRMDWLTMLTCQYFGIAFDNNIFETQKRPYTYIRHIVTAIMYINHYRINVNGTDIAKYFNHNHSTLNNSIYQVDIERKRWDEFRRVFSEINEDYKYYPDYQERKIIEIEWQRF